MVHTKYFFFFLQRTGLRNKEINRILKTDHTRLTDTNSKFKNLLSNEQFEKQEVTRKKLEKKKKKSVKEKREGTF